MPSSISLSSGHGWQSIDIGIAGLHSQSPRPFAGKLFSAILGK